MSIETTSIKLKKPLVIDGTEFDSLDMREPTVDDQLAADKFKGSAGEQEVFMFANLCGLAPDDLRKLSLGDYKKLQNAFLDFTA
jgi:hypothetical protein